ncbi:hypothetical protein EW146_g6277 [Bondarzewia mesenterica]|uniref:Epoxide hydrolase N-terminal domain-containing protein n=1 Tax=Bondarzewia mesenterica TaxID=1095465 RepID=A0A4S4LUS3_9AGAM|nr:hypothetical protein EW146_g6277 [Bondarzewia mesenterica]
MTTEQPFKISVRDEDITLLKQKLNLSRLPDELDEAGWAYGVPLEDVQRLLARWKEGYDWRKYEAELNKLPMFTRDVEIDGFDTLNIHYVHQKSEVEGAIPLLFVHGWPGNFIEVRKVLPLLTASSADHPSFHVVALSLPGFGFSEAPRKKGFTGPQYAELGNKLMIALGYNEYVTQGGDWGHTITRIMAATHGPKNVKAWHTNMPFAPPPTLKETPRHFFTHMLSRYTPQEKAGLARMASFRATGTGYSTQQATQPQTLGYSLADSPVGLLAWIYEKLVNWTDSYPWDDDEVLTWISVYWFSRAGPAASVRIYYEMAKSGHISRSRPAYAGIPMGVSYFPKELGLVPLSWLRATGNVVSVSSHDKGGHFAAHERPEDLVTDVRKMFAKGGPAYGVVPGKDGY